MLQRVLVLEKNRETAERLITALRRNGADNVTLAPTMREACLIVAQQPHDLAFVPLEDAEELLHSLRALQPDLKMMLTTAESQAQFTDNYQDHFQGLLHTPVLERELPALLSGGKRPQPALEIEPPSQLKLDRLEEACNEIGVTGPHSPVQMVVLSLGRRTLGLCGQGDASQAFAVTELISRSWRKGQFTAQVQFLQLPDYYDPRLIYSRSVSGSVLSLTAEPKTDVVDLRKAADRLAARMSPQGRKQAEPAQSRVTLVGRSNGSPAEDRPASTYVVAWQPVKPLPAALQLIVRQCLSQLTEENGCTVRHLSVTPAVVHLVITCPKGKSAAWAVYTLKSGINNEILYRFGIRSSIWRKGFYAAESEQPLNESELNMLLAP